MTTLNNESQRTLLDSEAVHHGRMSKVERYKWACVSVVVQTVKPMRPLADETTEGD